MLSKLAGSNAQGHTHRLSPTYRTHHTIDDDGRRPKHASLPRCLAFAR